MVSTQIDTICQLVDQLSPGPEETVGVAVAGRVSDQGDWFAVNNEILAKVDAVPIKAYLSNRLNRPVRVENDATAAAIGEFGYGAGQGTNSMAYITVSTGVGGGIILDGRPLRSRSGLAGHVGFTTSRIADQKCGSGRYHTIESVASGRAIARAAADIGQTGLDGKVVYQAHLTGESWASELVHQSAAGIAELSVNLKSILDIDLVVIGGGIGLAEGYVELVGQILNAEPPLFRPAIARAALGNFSALIGVLAPD
jgi:N-acylmannosamine kinase